MTTKYTKVNYGRKDHPDYPLYDWKGKMTYVVGKFMARDGITEYNVLPTDDNKIPADDADKTKLNGVSQLKLLNKTA